MKPESLEKTLLLNSIQSTIGKCITNLTFIQYLKGIFERKTSLSS